MGASILAVNLRDLMETPGFREQVGFLGILILFAFVLPALGITILHSYATEEKGYRRNTWKGRFEAERLAVMLILTVFLPAYGAYLAFLAYSFLVVFVGPIFATLCFWGLLALGLSFGYVMSAIVVEEHEKRSQGLILLAFACSSTCAYVGIAIAYVA